MIYNVSQLLKSPVGTSMRVELDPADHFELDDVQVRLAGEVTGTVRLHRTNQGILADGTASAPVELVCDCCLEPYAATLNAAVREQFSPTVDVLTGVPLPPPEDELVFPIDHNHLLDLREALRQNLVLALPMQLRCREDCAGLCPQCGRNLNDGSCGCEPDTTDDRFAALRALLD